MDREAHAFVSVSVLITEMRVIITNAIFMLFMLFILKKIFKKFAITLENVWSFT